MASIIALPRTAAPASRRAAPRPTVRGFVGRLRDAIRRDSVRRELLRLSDRQLRDIGLDRRDLMSPADVHLAALAPATRFGTSLPHAPGR
jgi:uncharacterized protein YjiS (DUF1127 family)